MGIIHASDREKPPKLAEPPIWRRGENFRKRQGSASDHVEVRLERGEKECGGQGGQGWRLKIFMWGNKKDAEVSRIPEE